MSQLRLGLQKIQFRAGVLIPPPICALACYFDNIVRPYFLFTF